MDAKIQLRNRIIEWSNRFPLDYSFRKRRQIVFGSDQHKALSEIDIYMEWLEEQLHKDFIEEASQQIKDEKEYENGVWLKETQTTDEDEDLLFKKIKVGQFNAFDDVDSINIG
jgi:hypothetical protein